MGEEEKTHEGTEKVRHQIDDVLDELQGLADGLRLKMHLGSQEAKAQWAELEPKMHELQGKTDKAVERTAAEAKDLAADLKQRFQKLKKDLGG